MKYLSVLSDYNYRIVKLFITQKHVYPTLGAEGINNATRSPHSSLELFTVIVKLSQLAFRRCQTRQANREDSAVALIQKYAFHAIAGYTRPTC